LNLFDGKIFSNCSDRHWCRRIDLERGEHLNSLILADLGIFVTVDSSNPEDSIILIDPFIEGGHKIFGLAV